MTRPTYTHAVKAHHKFFNAKRRVETPWVLWYKTPQWLELRAWQLDAFPYCAIELKSGKQVKATHADHKIPHKGNRDLFFDPRNLQSLCAHCHNAIKQAHEKRTWQVPVGEDGWPTQEPKR